MTTKFIAPTAAQIEEFKALKSITTVWIIGSRTPSTDKPYKCEDGVYRVRCAESDATGYMLRIKCESTFNDYMDAAEDWHHSERFSSCPAREYSDIELKEIKGEVAKLEGLAKLPALKVRHKDLWKRRAYLLSTHDGYAELNAEFEAISAEIAEIEAL